MSTARHVTIAIILTAWTWSLSACSSGGGQLEATSVFIPVHKGSPGGDAALLTGVLAEEDGCLVVRSGEITFLPIWPLDAIQYADNRLTWGSTPKSAVLGETVSIGGGEREVGGLSEFVGDEAASAMPCSPNTLWVVANT